MNAKGDKDKIADELGNTYYLNSDHTQLLFYSDGKNYICSKSADKEKPGGSPALMPLLPETAGFMKVYNCYAGTYTCSVNSFRGILMPVLSLP